MGQGVSSGQDKKKKKGSKEKPKYEPPVQSRFGRKKRRGGPATAEKLPNISPSTRCKLKLLRMERIKDHLLLEEEFVTNSEILKPFEKKQEEEKKQLEEIRGNPLSIGTLEEIIDDDHAIVTSPTMSDYYVSILSFADKELLEPGCSVNEDW